ncbi:PilS domain protein [Pectobacterium parmentieri WPP163]|uniref:Prepilin-type N-terminal cleavage/methylation domain-containing protein n=1 Tax=Pectobacterium carotovorum TaxID=554 RepID=A0A419AS09_PECCA|nr:MULTISPECIES: type 4 pilus major pilin [Pectobacterium]ACX87546.1 PilS domain protein [Pectobacterium parmentieri WPP163]MBA0212471.1 prepilin-type N-terminal cleavage/methylation domain-containing protein [Pectobacterium brasiliense]RJL48208.1 prepilin-type N-terminal cleavage/methylation domain-containing protein [Pectobacterium carotovorum]
MVLLKNRKYRKGFSLLELILVLGVIAGLIVSAFIVYPKVQAAQRAEAEVKNISTIKAGIKELYSSSAGYDGLTTDVLVKAKVFPDNMLINDNGTIKPVNSFKGDITVIPIADNQAGIGSYGFTIRYNNVPSAECMKIVTALQSGFSRVIIQIPIANATILTVDQIAQSCSARTASTLIFQEKSD